ncbi:MAG TPA: C25 family cysteine peptidase [Candidatus Krumholzibacteria bacterium]|nr:C25 family cysteine peptidase [Candidatus Krumholzibacteria bacterium]
MRLRFTVFAALVLCLLAAGTAGAAWVDQGSATPTKPLITAADRGDAVVLHLEIPGYDLSSVDIDGASYSKVMLPGHAPLMDRGYPELPFVAASVAIPGTGAPEARLLNAVWDEVDVAPVRPSKGHFSRDVDPASVSTVFADLYAKGGVFPQGSVSVAEPFIVRDLRGVSVHVHAFRYDADRGKLLVLRSADVEITVKGTGLNEKGGAVRAQDPEFQRIYRNLFANYGAEKYVAIGHPGNMLVVVDDALQGAIQPFVDWKIQKGIPVEVVTTSSIGATVAGVQAAIDARYASAAGLTYVVLVGDIAQIPTHIGTAEGNGSDATYAMVEGGDLYCDLFISRISASNPTDVQTQINKFVRYEREPDTGAAAAWYGKGAGLASNEGSPSDAQRADWVRDDLLAYGFTDVDQIYQPSGTTAQILSAVNDGRSVMYYIGHGSGTSWSNPPFSNSNVPSMANGWKQPWVIDVSCSNGTTTLNPCMAEAFLRAGTPAAPQGAVGMFSSWGTCAWVPPTVMMDEAIDLYVAESTSTLGALFYFGAMKALDTYPGTGGEGHALVEQYSIFGDCSLEVRSQAPAAVTPSHLPVVFFSAPAFDVQAAAPGAVCTLSRDGVILGSGVADASGNAVVTLDVPVTTPGDVTLTVTGFNLVPYQTALAAVSPSSVSFAPASIPAGVATDVTVTVLGSDGVTPVADVDVWAEGLGYATAPVATDAAGQAVLSLEYPFGPSLTVLGREQGATYDLFDAELPVVAAALTAPDLTVSTTFGMSDQFGLNLPGTLNAVVGEAGATLFAVLPDGTELSTGAAFLEVTPAQVGSVTGIIAVPGYDAYSESFAVVEAYGTLSGVVSDGASPLAGALVRGLDGLGAEVFAVTSGGDGSYALSEDVLVDTYTIETSLFGYLTQSQSFFLGYGANVLDVTMPAAPAGAVTGVVTEAGSGLGLVADIKAYRSDDGSLYQQTTSAGDGTFALSLPYFGYDLRVSSVGHVPVQTALTVDQPAVTADFVLDVTNGNILVIDDSGALLEAPAKLDGKDGHVIEPGYTATRDRSTSVFQNVLTGLGYAVTVETAGATDPGTWGNYDMIVTSSGASTSPLGATALRSALAAYAASGGKVLTEGGEVAYSHNDDAAYAADVLHISAWNGDSSGSLTVADAGHALVTNPVSIAGPISVSYSGYGDQDRVTAAAGAVMVCNWSSYAGNASVVAYDPNPAPLGGQTVFFTFNLAAADAAAQADLIQNAAAYLLNPETGDASVSGTVTLAGIMDASGVLVEALPGGGSVVTGSDGAYAFSGLFAGAYTIRASKATWSTELQTVTLSAGQSLTGVDLTLTPVSELTECSTPALAIPDNNAAGVSDVIAVGLAPGVTITDLSVFVDITHTYQGDLIVNLTSPTGTTVRLHNRTGSSADNIYGWYPGDLTPAEALDALVGQEAGGDWTLTVSDNAGVDTGTLNEWCVMVAFSDPSVGVEDVTRAGLALGANYPNPFNPATTIRFTTPREGPVSLKVFDLSGRLVRTLVDESLSAAVHEVTWRGQDDAGRRVASGSYYYRLSAGGETLVRKMTLLK